MMHAWKTKPGERNYDPVAWTQGLRNGYICLNCGRRVNVKREGKAWIDEQLSANDCSANASPKADAVIRSTFNPDSGMACVLLYGPVRHLDVEQRDSTQYSSFALSSPWMLSDRLDDLTIRCRHVEKWGYAVDDGAGVMWERAMTTVPIDSARELLVDLAEELNTAVRHSLWATTAPSKQLRDALSKALATIVSEGWNR